MTTEPKNEPEASADDRTEVIQQNPGLQLKAAREAAGLSVQEVATRLNLRRQVVVDIENDNAEHHISATFFKGYIRSYAKLLNIPESVVLASYEATHEPIQPAQMHTFSQRLDDRSNDSRLKWLSIIIILILLISLGIWWWQNHSFSDILPSSMNGSESNPTQSNTIPLSQPSDPATDIPVVTEKPDDNATPTAEPAHPDATTPAPAMPSPPANAAQTALHVAEQLSQSSSQTQTSAVPTPSVNRADPNIASVATSVDAPVQADEPTATDKTMAASVNSSSSSPAISQLQLRFSKACWIEVRDASDNRLAIGVKQVGQVIVLNGQPPYKVTLGVPDGVTIEYGGQPFAFNHSSVEGRTVRLTIPNS
ncbi:RodZ domain-containing protein [Celerinatantimonas sp. YJH-8]|uniref:RodZ domain-containing protein n=1 Tax=Celerinatantimonas sp. YJH-8 TaxID=3228714 RepID=UPI0038C9585D